MKSKLIVLSLLLLAFLLSASSHAGDGVEERVRITNPARFPFQTVAKVKIGPAGGGRGTAFLVAPCTLLTNGHVVWNANTATWRTIPSIHPASYYDESSSSVIDPYGSRVPINKATNTSWISTLDKKYDYGALFINSSFESLGLNTYMPVTFNETPSFINLSGYPSEELPTGTGAGAYLEQWRGFGDGELYEPRVANYAANSTGGASGSPVWVYYTSGERYVVAVNRGHNNTYDGIGTRFVSQNQNVVQDWMNRQCSGVPSALSIRDLLDGKTLSGKEFKRFGPSHFNLVPANRDDFVPYRTVIQYIEGQTYKWQEFRHKADTEEVKDNAIVSPRRAIRILEPVERNLTPEQAAAFLSASLLWQQGAEPTQPVVDKDDAKPSILIAAPEAIAKQDNSPERSIEEKQ